MTKRKKYDEELLDAQADDHGGSGSDPVDPKSTTAEQEQSDEPSYVKIAEVKLGDTLVVMGDEYDCLHDGEEKEVKQNEHGRLFVDCEEGRHYLDRTDIHDYVVGLGMKEWKTA